MVVKLGLLLLLSFAGGITGGPAAVQIVSPAHFGPDGVSPARHLAALDALRESDTRYALWTSSSFEPEAIGGHDRRIAMAGRAIIALKEGLPGWGELRRFEHRGKRAIVYERLHDGGIGEAATR